MLGQMVALVLFGSIVLAYVRVQRLQEAGHITRSANIIEIMWSAFAKPLLRVLWAGLYEMIRATARGTRQKPPFGEFLMAWITGRTQFARKAVTVTTRQGETRVFQVKEVVKPPRPPGRPRTYPEGWRKARLTGRPRGRPCKVPDGQEDDHGSR